MQESLTILVVEDDVRVRQNLQQGLQEASYTPTCVGTGVDALQHLSQVHTDLVLLDLGLPDTDGLDLLEQIRRERKSLPIIVLTARHTIGERVTGLERGADDYLTKPFAFAELLARMKALLRRSQSSAPDPLVAGTLKLDPQTRSILGSTEKVDLTPKEFDLLSLFVRYVDDVVSRDMIARVVWQEPSRLTSLNNIIDVHVSHLREKLKASGQPESILTIRGIGYSLSTTS